MNFSLQRFEAQVWRRDHEAACRELLLLLTELDRQHGLTSLDETGCTRIASAAACLLSDPGLQFSPQWVARVMSLQRWLGALFNASALGNGDAVIGALNTADLSSQALGLLAISPRDAVKFCLLYGAESGVPLNISALWHADRRLAVGLALALLSPRLLASPAAHAKREALLPWLAAHLADIDDVTDVPGDVLHDVYMQCSYADRADKHDIKRAISALVQRSLRRRGFASVPAASSPLPPPSPPPGRKPVLLVVVEWFMAGHSLVRTHSLSLVAARAHFEVVGIGYGFAVDAVGRAVFDTFVQLQSDVDVFAQLQQVQSQAQQRSAAVLYMPSVGMSALTMFLANLRVAPLQVMGTGHPATAHAAAVDLVMAESNYVGDPRCFAEPLLLLPPEAMPYRPAATQAATGEDADADADAAATAHVRALAQSPACGDGPATTPAPPPVPPPAEPAPAPAPAPGRRARSPQVVQIALCATLMKLNPTLLQACAAIVRTAPLPVHIRLLIGQAQGLIVPHLRRVVHDVLGDAATVQPQQPYADYCAAIAACDLFINPFPFGNCNGIIDCVGAGLVGVCKTGAELHAHTDEGMFRRLGMPDWLVTSTVAEYVDAVVRLASAHDERAALRALHAGPDKVRVFYDGKPQIMGEMLLQAARQHAAAAAQRPAG